MNADRSRLRCRRRVDGLHQVHVKGAAHGQTLREYRRAGKHGAVRAFFVLHHRYLQARLGERDLLQFVEVFRLLARAFLQNVIGQGEESAARADFLRVGSGREFPARLRLRRECPFPDHSHKRRVN